MDKEKIPFYNELVLPYHWLRAVGCARKWRFPARGMRVIGVTGTNGKTTTCFMLWKMLNEAGIKTGVMTTVGWGFKEIHKQIEHMTTESCSVLNERIRQLADEGVEVLVLEVTSHALAQGRIFGIPIEVAVMTNVTHEHLDYHKTFERYLGAKLKLFKRAKFGVVNADDVNAERFVAVLGCGGFGTELERFGGKNYASYGIKNGDFRAFSVELGVFGVKYACGDINSGGNGVADGRFEIKTQIPGKFNVYNSLAAVCVGRYFGLSDEQIVKGIFALSEVEGRMNFVDAGQDFKVLVDYAHTPDAILKVFESIDRDNFKGKIIAVHGGAGRRDESTRAPRGEIIGKNADIFLVTEDDSRDEKVEAICAEFVKGAKKAGVAFFDSFEGMAKSKAKSRGCVILDRKEAIFRAIEVAKKGDLVLILGKGHEKTILRAGGAEEFEDLKVAKEGLERVRR